MAKDPAFLFYSKDWMEGTAEMSAIEKGVYIDLLCHQHQKAGLPNDEKRLARLVGLADSEFSEVWNFLKNKFIEKDGKLYNKKLIQVMEERAEHSEVRTIVGTFGKLLKLKNLPQAKSEKIKKIFNCKDFLSKDKQNLSKLISNWLDVSIANLEIEDEIGIEDENTIKEKGTKEENLLKPFAAMLIDVDLLLEKVTRDPKFKMEFEQKGLPPGKFEQWLENFNKHLQHMGTAKKLEKDYRTHFTNWIKDQDIQNPDKYSPVKDFKNGKFKRSSSNTQQDQLNDIYSSIEQDISRSQ